MKKQETSPLLSFDDDDNISLKDEFLELSTMAIQVSLATVARIALTSIDSAFLGHLGVEPLAAASLAQVWTNVPLMGVWAAASALITLCGQAYGAENYELTGVWLQLGLVTTSILAIPVFIWFWCIESVLKFTTTDQLVIHLGVQFSRVLSFSILPSLIYACLRQYFQAMGIMLPTTIVGTCSIFIAIFANYVLIYGAFSWEGFGFLGSPLATVVASWFQPCALILYCVVWKKYHAKAWGGWRREAWTIDRLKTFMSIAGPIASNSLASNLAYSLVSLVAAKLGSDIIAANAVVASLWGLLWALFWGYGCSTQVRVANYLGAGKPKNAKQLAYLGFFCTIVCVGTLALVTIFLKNELFRIYSTDERILKLCFLVMPIFVSGFIIESIEVLTSAVLTGMGQVKVIFWTSLAGTWLIELPICYIGAILLDFGFQALWLAIALTEVFKLSVYLYSLYHIKWNDMAMLAMESMEAFPDKNSQDVEKESLIYMQAEVANQPTGYIASMPSPTTPQLSTPQAREELWHRIDPVIRRRASIISPSNLEKEDKY